ncbi:MAG: PorT family protein [Flavobacteriales bacterium]|nr:PorT family protein [Flavobacteriales bacterium]
MEHTLPSRTLPVLALCAIALLHAPLHAQDNTTTTTTSTTSTTDSDGGSSGAAFGSAFGVKGGVNWSNLWVKEVNDERARFGFHAGVFGRFVEPGSLGFQIEALYDQKGTTVKKSFGVVDQELTYKFDYITVPAVVVIPLGEVLELHGGAYAALMVLSETKTSGDLGSGSTDPGDSRFNDFDYGLVGGAAINIGMGQIGVRYEHGLGEIADNAFSSDVLGTSKNSTLQAYLAIGLGKR